MEQNLEIAADWLQRLDHPEVKEEEIQSWLEWFSASDANRKAFEEMQALRGTFRALNGDGRDELRRRVGLVTLDPAPDISTPNFSNSGRRAIKRHPRTLRFAAAASVCGLTLGLGAWWHARNSVTEATYFAPADHHRTVALDDGSSLVLGANAIVAVAYSRERRALDIQRGEAYFEVRRQPNRPFVVRAGSISVTAVGTAFNVQRSLDNVAVTVTEGRVAVDDEKTKQLAKLYLAVGQRAVLALRPSAPPSGGSKTAAATGWQNDRADFINTPLSQVLPIVNHYAPLKLLIDDPRVGDLTYSGTILRHHIDEWIDSLPKVYPIRTVPLQDGTVTLVSKSFEERQTTP